MWHDNKAVSYTHLDVYKRQPVGGADIFGVQWKYIDIAGGSMVEPGRPFLKEVSEWREKVRFPELDRWDWEKSAEENREFLNTDKLVTAWIFNGLFERLISFVDFEAAAVALIDEEQQDDVKALFQELADFYKRLIDKFVEYYHVDAIFFHDDWGSQRAPFFSLDTCREMIVPYMKQTVSYTHLDVYKRQVPDSWEYDNQTHWFSPVVDPTGNFYMEVDYTLYNSAGQAISTVWKALKKCRKLRMN